MGDVQLSGRPRDVCARRKHCQYCVAQHCDATSRQSRSIDLGRECIPADRWDLRGAAVFPRGHHWVQEGLPGRPGDFHAGIGGLLSAAFAEHSGSGARGSGNRRGVHLERFRRGHAVYVPSRAIGARDWSRRLRRFHVRRRRPKRRLGNSRDYHVALAVRYQHSVRSACAQSLGAMPRAGAKAHAIAGMCGARY